MDPRIGCLAHVTFFESDTSLESVHLGQLLVLEVLELLLSHETLRTQTKARRELSGSLWRVSPDFTALSRFDLLGHPVDCDRADFLASTSSERSAVKI